MRETAFAHGGAGQPVPTERAADSVGVWAGRVLMPDGENPPTELEGSFEKRRHVTKECDGHYADFTTEAGYD